MEPLLSSTGIPYLPNEGEAAPGPQPREFSIFAFVLGFIAIFAGFQTLWGAVRNTAVEHLLIDNLMVLPAAALLNVLTPHSGVIAQGQYLMAPGGGLQIVSACTGTEIYFLLTAALCVFPIPWRARLSGIAFGLAYVFGLNQVRVLVLFYARQANWTLFDFLHGIFLPTGLVLFTCLFFLGWTAGHAHQAASVPRA